MYPADPDKQHMYQRYAQAYDSGILDQIDPKEAAGYLQQFMQKAPVGMQQQVFQEYFSQMSPQRRQEWALLLTQRLPPPYAVTTNVPQQMAQGIVQVAQQRPDLLQQVFGQGGMGSSPVANAAVGELTALVAKHMLSLLTSVAVPLIDDVAAPLVNDVAAPLVRDVAVPLVHDVESLLR
jgi:hypothetical protein